MAPSDSPRDAARMPYAPETRQLHALRMRAWLIAAARSKTHLPPHKRYHPSASLRQRPGAQHTPLALSRRRSRMLDEPPHLPRAPCCRAPKDEATDGWERGENLDRRGASRWDLLTQTLIVLNGTSVKSSRRRLVLVLNGPRPMLERTTTRIRHPV